MYLYIRGIESKMFNLIKFINQYVTKRSNSMFKGDIEVNREKLVEKISGKSVLVIGGAGSIGSSFIKAILPFRPATLVVVDTNENALAELTRDLRSTKGMYVPNDYIPYPMDFASPVFEKMVPFNGATASADGSKGIVPKPQAGDQNKFLTGGCNWVNGSEIAKIM